MTTSQARHWFGTGLQLGLDWGMVFLYGLGAPGTSTHPSGTLTHASTHDAFLTGGDAGMRGGVVMPALLALAALLVHVRFSRRSVVSRAGGAP